MSTGPGLNASLLDSLQQALLAAVEAGGNRLLGFDEDALARCRELQGHCIAIDVIDLGFRLYCHPGEWGIRLSRHAPAREADATIAGHVFALLDLAAEEDKVSTSIRHRVSFHGNIALAQQLQKIIAELDIDWEEILAQQVGDVAAVQLHKGAKEFADWLRRSADSLLRTSGEYLREEARMSPSQAEFDRFQARNTELRHDVARAEARLKRLLDRTDSR